MATRHQIMQAIVRQYRESTGKQEVDLKAIAAWAVERKLMILPSQVDPLDMLARDFARAEREEIDHDEKTGHPYRVNHSVSFPGQQMTLWININQATRKPMHKSLQQRRNQMIGDGLQLKLDADHWNNINPKEEPIQIVLDFTDDVIERLSASEPEEKIS